MTSLQTSFRQVSSDDGYFIPIGDCRDRVYAYNTTSNTFRVAQWASTGYAYASTVTSTLQAGASLIRDMGKTIVSSGRTFRKVQLVVSTVASTTFGVTGPATGANPVEDYLTGYIEVGFGAPNSTPAPVAKYGR
jgi:hypothetical protein